MNQGNPALYKRFKPDFRLLVSLGVVGGWLGRLGGWSQLACAVSDSTGSLVSSLNLLAACPDEPKRVVFKTCFAGSLVNLPSQGFFKKQGRVEIGFSAAYGPLTPGRALALKSPLEAAQLGMGAEVRGGFDGLIRLTHFHLEGYAFPAAELLFSPYLGFSPRLHVLTSVGCPYRGILGGARSLAKLHHSLTTHRALGALSLSAWTLAPFPKIKLNYFKLLNPRPGAGALWQADFTEFGQWLGRAMVHCVVNPFLSFSWACSGGGVTVLWRVLKLLGSWARGRTCPPIFSLLGKRPPLSGFADCSLVPFKTKKVWLRSYLVGLQNHPVYSVFSLAQCKKTGRRLSFDCCIFWPKFLNRNETLSSRLKRINAPLREQFRDQSIDSFHQELDKAFEEREPEVGNPILSFIKFRVRLTYGTRGAPRGWNSATLTERVEEWKAFMPVDRSALLGPAEVLSRFGALSLVSDQIKCKEAFGPGLSSILFDTLSREPGRAVRLISVDLTKVFEEGASTASPLALRDHGLERIWDACLTVWLEGQHQATDCLLIQPYCSGDLRSNEARAKALKTKWVNECVGPIEQQLQLRSDLPWRCLDPEWVFQKGQPIWLSRTIQVKSSFGSLSFDPL